MTRSHHIRRFLATSAAALLRPAPAPRVTLARQHPRRKPLTAREAIRAERRL